MHATPHPSYPEHCCLGVWPPPLPLGGWSSAGETPSGLTHSLPCLSSRNESSHSSDDLQPVWSSEDPQIDEPVSGCHGYQSSVTLTRGELEARSNSQWTERVVTNWLRKKENTALPSTHYHWHYSDILHYRYSQHHTHLSTEETPLTNWLTCRNFSVCEYLMFRGIPYTNKWPHYQSVCQCVSHKNFGLITTTKGLNASKCHSNSDNSEKTVHGVPEGG